MYIAVAKYARNAVLYRDLLREQLEDRYRSVRLHGAASDRAMSQQLSLNLRLKDGSAFSNFLPGQNREALNRLRTAVIAAAAEKPEERMLFFWGAPGVGKTHLLQAACRLAQELGVAPVYIPLSEAGSFSVSMLEDIEATPLVCLDDVDRIAGNAVWEKALFHLSEQLRGVSATLIAAGSQAPNHIHLHMPELSTRLGWGPVYQLLPLDDAAKHEAVQLRARNRGFDIPEDVTAYILKRYPRDTHSLFDLLDRIDSAALAHQRRVTIPFIRAIEQLTRANEA